jgi:hypothetical protein
VVAKSLFIKLEQKLLLIRNLVLLKKFEIFLFKSSFLMMSLLVLYIIGDYWQMRPAIGENAIALLPLKFLGDKFPYINIKG